MADGSVTRRKDGRYELQIIIGKTLDGKFKRKSFYGKGPREVKRKRDEWLENQAKGKADLKTSSMEAWAMRWAETYKKPTVSPSTYKNTYINYIKNYIIPYFGVAAPKDITPADVQNFFNIHNDLSSAVLDKIKKVLNQIFESAIDNDLCIKNPCRNIKLPPYKKKNEKHAYTQAQANMVKEYAKNHPFGMDIIILLETGIRRGELLALKWSDIDFQNNLMYVKKAVTSSGEIGAPKSAAGVRVIPFSHELHDFLISKKPQKADQYVIESKTGGYMQQNNWDKRHRMKFMEDMLQFYNNKIPALTAHELRHTFGTLLHARGVDIYTIQKVMGHSDIRVTADTYIHNDINVLQKAMKLESS